MLDTFLSPTDNIVFQKIFGTEKNQDLLIHFLNDILVFGNPIKEVSFLETASDLAITTKNANFLQLVCSDNFGEEYIVIIYVSKDPDFIKSAPCYVAKAYSSQLNLAYGYYRLKEIIFFVITDFIMFPEKKAFKSDHVLLDKVTHGYLKNFSFTVLELGKFNKNIDEVLTVVDRWAYFFKYAEVTNKDDVVKIVGDQKIIERAYEELRLLTWNSEEPIDYGTIIKKETYQRVYNLNDTRDALYTSGSFCFECKKKLLHFVLDKISEQCAQNGSIRLIDLNFFNLPFHEVFDIALQYKTIFSAAIMGHGYFQQFLTKVLDADKEDFIVKCLAKDFYLLPPEFIISVTSEENRINIFKQFVNLDLLNFITHINYFFYDLEIVNLLSPQQKKDVLKTVLSNCFECIDIEGFLGCFASFDLPEESGFIGVLCKELKDIFADSDEEDLIATAKLLKLKIFDLDFCEIWDDNNKEIFNRELKFLSEYHDLEDEQSAFIFVKIASWFVYTVVLYNIVDAGHIFTHNLSQLDKDVIKKTFKEIRSFANPNMRFKLTQLFLEKIYNYQQAYEFYVNLLKGRNQVAVLPTLIFVSYLPWSSAALMQTKSFIEKIIQTTLDLVNTNRLKYKDGKHMRPLIMGLYSVFSQEKIDNIEEKFALVHKILGQKFASHKNNWLLIEAVFMPAIVNHSKFIEFYNNIIKKEVEVRETFEQICFEVFQVQSQERSNRYYERFGIKHHQTALLTYYSKMQSLPEHDRVKMLEVFNQYFNSVLTNGEGNYRQLRYGVNNNPHLKKIFDHYPDLKSQWMQSCSHDFQQFVADYKLYNVVEKQFDLKSFVTNMIMQNHLLNGYHEHFKEYIRVEQSRKLQIRSQLQQEKHMLEQQEKLAENLKNRLNSCNLQLELIDTINNDYISCEEQIKKLKKIKKYVDSIEYYCEFEENLIQAIRALTKKDVKKTTDYSEWKIVDTDDYWDLFMSGTDIEGSCQKVDGDPKINKCLMGYVMNGDYRMIAIKNAQGITAARCMIHLLWDSNRNIACLFIEQAYPFYLSDLQERALIQLAINKAKHLGLSLVSIKGENADSLDYYGNPLVRIEGGIANWVYSDANYGIINNGSLEITNAKFVYNQDKAMLYEEALKHKVKIYKKGLFFSASKYATATQPYGPYSDHLCFPEDPITKLAIKCSKLSPTI